MTDIERHTYEYEVELGTDSAAARVVRLAGKGRRVLEVGAGPGSITRHLISSNHCDVVALEIDPSAIAKLEKICPRIYSLDLNDEKWPEALANEDKFDVVVAADVLEHVYDPVRTLKEMKSLLRAGGEIVLSLPHVGHCVINACLLGEDFDYRKTGLLDRTHVRFFGLKNINKLYADAGLGITEAEFVIKRPSQTEFFEHWNRLQKRVQWALMTNPFGYVYQVVTKARIMKAGESGIDLMSMSTEPVTVQVKGILKDLGRPYVTPAARARLRALSQRMGIR